MHLLAVLCALLCSASLADDATDTPNLVRNPGFEALDADGAAEGWGLDMKVYTPVHSPLHTGATALQYVNTDPQRYVLTGQPIELERGRAFEVSVWIKTQDIKGNDNGATICLEWSDKGGQYLGGFYPAGFKGTTDWRQLKVVSGRIPKEAARCTVTCYVRKGMTGTAWWDDVAVRPWRGDVLSTLLLEPNYRGQVLPTTRAIELQADLALDDYHLRPRDIALRTQLTRLQDLKVVYSHSAPAGGPRTRLVVPRTGLAAGKYQLELTVVRRQDGRPLGSDRWRLEVMRPAVLARRVSYIDEHNRLIREGKPFFPLGMYWSGISDADLKVYADSSFNCLMPYGMPTTEQMALVHKYGLKVIYSVKDIYYGSSYCPASIKTTPDERKLIEAKAETFRTHPALLAWYLNDELSVEYAPRLEAHQQWLEELDPDHPTWVVLYQVDQLDRYLKTFDAIGTDPYPIPGSAARAGQWTATTVRSAAGRRPVWMVPQVFNWAVYRKPEDITPDLRPPTLAEMRSMTWQCIARGARGLIYYSFFDLKRDKQVPFDTQWGRVKQVAAEVKAMEPVILSVETPPRIEAGEYDWLMWTTRQVGAQTYLIAVNADGRPHTTRFALPGPPRTVRLHGRGDRVELHAGNRLEVALEPFEVRSYVLEF